MTGERTPRFTDKDREVIGWLLARRSPIPPSLDEMAEGLGLNRSTVNGRLLKLRKYGWVTDPGGKSRSTVVTAAGRDRYAGHLEAEQ